MINAICKLLGHTYNSNKKCVRCGFTTAITLIEYDEAKVGFVMQDWTNKHIIIIQHASKSETFLNSVFELSRQLGMVTLTLPPGCSLKAYSVQDLESILVDLKEFVKQRHV